MAIIRDPSAGLFETKLDDIAERPDLAKRYCGQEYAEIDTDILKMTSSEPFEIIGLSGKKFYADGDWLSTQSPVLEAEIIATILEERPRRLEIQDVNGDIDDDTVEIFLHWNRRGGRSVPRLHDDALDIGVPVEGQGSFVERVSKGLEEVPKSDEDIKAQETQLENGTPTQERDILDSASCGCRDQRHSVLLSLARLYVFGVRYVCLPLQKLCARRIRRILVHCPPDSDGLRDVMTLAQHIFTHTIYYENRRDELRDLIISYVIPNFRLFISQPDFIDFMFEENGFREQLTQRQMGMLHWWPLEGILV